MCQEEIQEIEEAEVEFMELTEEQYQRIASHLPVQKGNV